MDELTDETPDPDEIASRSTGSQREGLDLPCRSGNLSAGQKALDEVKARARQLLGSKAKEGN
jgi:hypothetical protein